MSSDAVSMSSSRPYLIRALHDWIIDNSMTPYLLVDVSVEGIEVPMQHVEDGKIILNISPTAVTELQLGNELIGFTARFDGRPFNVFVPIHAVMAIYAQESGQGMAFQGDGQGDAPPEPPQQSGKGPRLKVVK